MGELRGYALTVLGPVSREQLGIVLPHEHIFFDGSKAWMAGRAKERYANLPVTMANLWLIKGDPTGNLDDIRFHAHNEAVRELLLFKAKGGRTVVEVTVRGLDPNPMGLRRVARATGLNIIAATGYYVSRTHPRLLEKKTIPSLVAELRKDVEEGFGDTGIRAGVVKIGVGGAMKHGTMRIHKNEEKLLVAASIVQREMGVPISIHTPRHLPTERAKPSSWWGLRILDILEDAGARLDRVIVCHLDRCIHENLDYQVQIAKRGAYIEYDLWGKDYYYKIFREANTCDSVRLERIKALIKQGCLHRILLSQDICMKIERATYGGYGYSHILRNVVPMMRDEGITYSQIDLMVKENAKRILAIV